MLYAVAVIKIDDISFSDIKEIILFLKGMEVLCGIGFVYPQFISQQFLRIMMVNDYNLTKDIEKRFLKMKKILLNQ